MIEVQCLDAVVRADTMRRRRCAEPCRVCRFLRRIPAMAIRLLNQRVVNQLRNYVISLSHDRFSKSLLNVVSPRRSGSSVTGPVGVEELATRFVQPLVG